MKKHLLLLAWLLTVATPGNKTAEASVFADQEGFFIAKAVKLGRGNAYSIAADASLNTGANDTQLKKGECETNEECPSDKKCMSYKCVDNCYNISCKSGYTTELTSNGCCCVPSSCPSGQRAEGYACVNNCAGVNCINGYFAVPSSKGCCCEPETQSNVVAGCASGYTLVNGKCVKDTPTCSANCSTCNNGTCTRCNSGFTLTNGNCLATSVVIEKLQAIENPRLNN